MPLHPLVQFGQQSGGKVAEGAADSGLSSSALPGLKRKKADPTRPASLPFLLPYANWCFISMIFSSWALVAD